jgi:hypothetical protein
VASLGDLRVNPVELMHPLREVGLRRLDDDVIMVGHCSVGVTPPVEWAVHLPERIQPNTAVFIVMIDRLTPASLMRKCLS